MAITQDYVSAAGIEGNDYKGATFTDGAFANATLTLTKAGAFAATKVNHWLYLDDNGSGEVTTGYYRVTDITGAPNAVVLHADIRSGANDPTDVVCTQHAGTTLLPWRSLQGAFDLCTRNATDGNQVNLKAGTAQVNAAALDLTTLAAGGALAPACPLIVRGYTSAANDGGMGEINAGGATMWVSNYGSIVLVDLEIHNFGNNDGISSTTAGCIVEHCEVHKGASTPSGKALIKFTNDYCAVIGCYVHDGGSSSTGINLSGDGSLAISNYVSGCITGITGANADGFSICNNIVLCAGTTESGIIIGGTSSFWIFGNIVYNTAAGTGVGINLGNSAGRYAGMCINNIAVGWSGSGGIGIGSATAGVYTYMAGYNAFYNNTTPFSVADTIFIDNTANDVSLVADPFTSASTGDFSLTAAAKTALAAGFPTQYFGAHANTDSHLNIGPIQLQATACDYPSEDDVRDGVNYDSGGSTGNMTLPAVGDVQTGVQFGTSGTEYTGTFAVPAVGKVIDDTSYGAGGVEYTGTYKAVATGDVQSGVTFGAASAETGTFVSPAVGDVQTGITYGNAAEYTGTFDAPTAAKVIDDTSYGAGGVEFTGTYHAPDVAEVIDSATFGAASAETGTVHLPDVGEVTSNATFGAGSALTGTYHRPETAEVISTATFGINSGQTGTVVQASVGDVQAGVTYGPGSTLTGTFVSPDAADVRSGETYGNAAEFTGTLDLPLEADVEFGVQFDGLTKTGAFVVPGVGDVEAGVTYGAAAEFTGTFAVPVEANVRNTVQYGAGGVEFTGTYVAGGGGGGSYLDSGSYSGMWLIDDYLTFAVQVRDSTGAASDADAVPSYAVYEDESAVAVASGNMAKLGAITGYYTERIQLTAVAGFEAGKCYHIRVAATVGGVATAARGDVFQMGGQQLSTDAVADVAAAVGALVPAVAISASTAASVSSGAIGIRTHHTLSQAITSTMTAALNTATKVWLAVKSKRSDTDAQSVIFIEATGGLTVLAGAAYTTVAHGTLVVGGVAGAWTITIGMDEVATGLLTAYAETMLWAECKALVAGATIPVWDGVCDVSQGIVQTVT